MAQFRLTVSLVLLLILSLSMATAVAAAPSSSSSSVPRGLTVERCGDSVCLSWTRGTRDYTYQTVLFWEAGSTPEDGGDLTIGASASQARVPLDDLNIQPSSHRGDTVSYIFQIMGVQADPRSIPIRDYSNEATLHLPKGLSGLSAELCERSGQAAVCLSWTPGVGDYTYQEIKYWETDHPNARGSRIVLPDVSATDIAIIHMNRSGAHHGNVSYTFQAVGVIGEFGHFDYAGYSNEVRLTIPAHLMERPDNNDKKAPPAQSGKKDK